MPNLFPMPSPDVGYLPHVSRVFSFGVAAELALSRAFVMALTGILLWDANGVQVEEVVAAFREPKDGLMQAAEARSLMAPESVGPNHSIP
jgi:hypothetical protein